MDDMYPRTFSEAEIQDIANELVSKHGTYALQEASARITECHARGEFSLSESWVWIRQRIRELEAASSTNDANLNEGVTVSE